MATNITRAAFTQLLRARLLISQEKHPSLTLLRHYHHSPLFSSMNNNNNNNTSDSNGQGRHGVLTTSTAAARTNPPPNPTDKTVRVSIKGRVQGVFYRNWTIENARQLGLKGWVRNRRDGSVEALFSGDPDSVHEMEQRCRRGPPDAVVTGFQVFPSTEDPGHGFHRMPTV